MTGFFSSSKREMDIIPTVTYLIERRKETGQAGVEIVVEALGVEGYKEGGVGEAANWLPDGVRQQAVGGTCNKVKLFLCDILKS